MRAGIPLRKIGDESERNAYDLWNIALTTSCDLDKGAHSVHLLYYQFVQVVKYRKNVFVNDAIVDLLKRKTREIAETFNVDILEIECDKDHFHMLFKSGKLRCISLDVIVFTALMNCGILSHGEALKSMWE